MKSFILIAALAITLLGCGKPQDIVFGVVPLETFASSGDKLGRIPESERKLVVAYLTALNQKTTTVAKDPPATGRTFAEVLTSAKVWEKAEAEDAKTYGGICRRYGSAIEAVAIARDNMDVPSYEEIVAMHPVLRKNETNSRAVLWSLTISLKSFNVNDSPSTLKQKAYEACLNSNLYFGNESHYSP